MRQAIELHRPVMLDKYAHQTGDPQKAKWIRCQECRESVPPSGCNTWKVANS